MDKSGGVIMNNRYESMRQLRDRLDELFRLCGIQTQPVDIRQAPALVRLAEKLFQDEGLCSYLKGLDEQTEQALRIMKDREPHVWNNENNECRIRELEQKCRDVQKPGEGLDGERHGSHELDRERQEARKLRQELDKERRETRELRQELDRERWEIRELRQELDRERQKAREFRQELDREQQEVRDLRKESEQLAVTALRREKADARDSEMEQTLLKLIKGVITVRDKLLIQKNWIEEQIPEEENACKLVDGQLRETARCLQNVGVEILEDSGIFDSRCHTVVETRPAESEGQTERIAETVRPGYRFRGEILRSQEVVLYVGQ